MFYIFLLLLLFLGILALAAYQYFKKGNANITIKPLDYAKPIITGSSIEYKLRNTIYALEQQILQLQDEIENLYNYQLHILDSIAKPSFVPLNTQKLYFHSIHPFKKEDRYYYERDLKKEISEEELTQKKQTLENYNVHIQVTLSKWTLHIELLKVHQQNLKALEELEDNKKQMQKDNLLNMTSNFDRDLQNESNTQYAIQLLSVIEDELQNRAEYLRQYISLQKEYDTSQNIQAHQVYKQKIDDIIHEMNKKA